MSEAQAWKDVVALKDERIAQLERDLAATKSDADSLYRAVERLERQNAALLSHLAALTKRLPTDVDGLESPICAYCRRDAKYGDTIRDYTADHAPDCEWMLARAALSSATTGEARFCIHCGQPEGVPGGKYGGGKWVVGNHFHDDDHDYPAVPPLGGATQEATPLTPLE